MLRSLPKRLIRKFLGTLNKAESEALLYDWAFWARPTQHPPPGNWTHWLILAGRGFGKTRTGAEWVRARVEAGQARHIALIAPTLGDARAVMVEGESGLLAVCPPDRRPKFEPSKHLLTWPCGAKARLFSADQPERLRGPQHDTAWADELCAWRLPDAGWDMLMFGLRLGGKPQCCITTTPKPIALLKRLVIDPAVAVTTGSTYENIENLAPSFARDVIAKYENTRLGRQELAAELLWDVPGALWSRDQIDGLYAPPTARLERIVVAIDPPATAGSNADACGIIVAARSGRMAYVLADRSCQGLSPLGWAARAVEAYHDFQADRIIAEGNQGGDMVLALLHQIDPNVAVRRVHARRGKVTRAEPVAALYEQGRVFHAAPMPALEDQMVTFTGAPSADSPDRLDALVWALADLMLTPKGQPRLRSL